MSDAASTNISLLKELIGFGMPGGYKHFAPTGQSSAPKSGGEAGTAYVASHIVESSERK